MNQQELIFSALKETHMHVIGSSGYGKSKFLEWLLRWRIRESKGFALIDWHGTLYNEVLEYLAYIEPSKKVYLLDPSREDYVVGFNPFVQKGRDISALVSRRIDSTIKPFGALDTDLTTQLAETLRMIYAFAAETGEPIHNAELMLFGRHRAVRKYAIANVKAFHIGEQLAELADLSDHQLRVQVSSARRRLERFLFLDVVQRMIARTTDNLIIKDILEEGAILLVNLSGIPPEAAKLIGALLFNEFREAAIGRAGTKRRYVLMLDEFQEYITHDLAGMLNEVRKGGLSLVLSHQHLAQLGKDETLIASVQTNARLKFVFGGLDHDTACTVAKEIRLPSIVARQVERQFITPTVVGHRIEKLVNMGYSKGAGQSSNWQDAISETLNERDEAARKTHTHTASFGGTSTDSETESQTETRLLVPILEDMVHSEQARDLATKIAIEAQKITALKKRQVYIKFPEEPQGIRFTTPWLKSFKLSSVHTQAYARKTLIEQGALPPEEIDALIKKSREDFLAKVNEGNPPPESDDHAPRKRFHPSNPPRT